MKMNDKLKLEFPQSLGHFRTYEDAQRAVDYLADNEFPVQNLMIVGTNLKLVERITGRRTLPKVLVNGALSGITTGLLVGLMLMFFVGGNNAMLMLFAGLGTGVVLGALMAGLGYSLSNGKRDFDSVRDTVATSFEVLVEHRVFGKAREMLAKMPGYRGEIFS